MRLVGITYVMTLFVFGVVHHDRFKDLHPVESYEIRPGVLMMPTYSRNGELCNVDIEKRHFSPKTVDIDAEMSEKQVREIFDELAPMKGRGRPLNFDNGGSVTFLAGQSAVTKIEYENVALHMYGRIKTAPEFGYIAAVIDWKRKDCA